MRYWRSVHTGAVIHASSRATASVLRELFPHSRIEMIHLGAPQRRIAASSQRPETLLDIGHAPFIVAVGTVEKRKNYPRLIEAFAIAADENSDLQLVIAGSVRRRFTTSKQVT